MKTSNFTDEELDGVLYHLSNTLEDIDRYIDTCYDSVMFIGTAASSDEDLSDALMLSINLCMRHYLKKEDYEKLKKLKDFVDLLQSEHKTVVEDGVINEIKINSN